MTDRLIRCDISSV